MPEIFKMLMREVVRLAANAKAQQNPELSPEQFANLLDCVDDLQSSMNSYGDGMQTWEEVAPVFRNVRAACAREKTFNTVSGLLFHAVDELTDAHVNRLDMDHMFRRYNVAASMLANAQTRIALS